MSPYLRALRAKIGSELVLLPGVAAIVRDEQGRILLQRRSDDLQWCLPAGAIEPGEEPARALVREVWEETGLLVVPERILGVVGGAPFRHTYPNYDQVEATTIVFQCRSVGGSPAPRDDESLEVRYFAAAEMPPLVMPYPPHFFGAPGEPAVPYFHWDAGWLQELEHGNVNAAAGGDPPAPL